MELEELKELFVNERISVYLQAHLEHGREELAKSEEFATMLDLICPQLTLEFEHYINWMANHGGDEQIGLYLHGLRDGCRIMMELLKS